jgi:hypothetical protein
MQNSFIFSVHKALVLFYIQIMHILKLTISESVQNHVSQGQGIVLNLELHSTA